MCIALNSRLHCATYYNMSAPPGEGGKGQVGVVGESHSVHHHPTVHYHRPLQLVLTVYSQCLTLPLPKHCTCHLPSHSH